MGLETTTIKHILLLLNFILTVFGVILVGFGVFVLVSGGQTLVDHGENVAGKLIIVVGVLIIIATIFGCLAAIHESRKKLIIFLFALVVLILLKLTMISMASQGSKDGLTGSVQKGFAELWATELKEPGALKYYENTLHCCGVNNTEDYHHIQHDIPKSCCKDNNCQLVANIYREGCYDTFLEYLNNKLLTFKIVGWILVLTEVAAAVFTWLLISSLKNQYRRGNSVWM